MTSTSATGSIAASGFDLNKEDCSQYFGDISATPTNATESSKFQPSKNTCTDDFTASIIVGSEFDSVEDAEAWYKKHSKSVGFSTRKDEIRRDTKSGKIVFRSWVCSCQGFRSKKYLDRTNRVREPKGITRNGCPAELHIKFNHSGHKYVVVKFIDDHSHMLASPYETQFLRSHRHVSNADFAHAQALQHVGVKVCQFMDFKSDQVGGFHNVGFVGKDLQNKLDASRRADLSETDSEAAIAYLSAKADSDLGVYFEYTLTEDNLLRNLFWTDIVARHDYECFGDVLAFDATYKKNAYNLPLVVLVGVNHHRRTTIFGFTLLSDETVDSYIWLLQTFLTAMHNKQPKSVITDGDNAMSKEIKTVMTGCSHRLCCWHLQRNAQANIKKEEFTKKFSSFMLKPFSIDEFERQWAALVSEMGLEKNEWVQKIYQKRGKWAEAYLKGIFFGGMRTTQRCESLNSYLSRFLKVKLKLYDFIRQIYRALYCIRHKEAKDEFDSSYSSPVLTTHLHSIEKHSSEVYTKNVFQWVRAEIACESSLIMVTCEKSIGSNIYTITKFQHPSLRWRVVFDVGRVHIACSCKMLESSGIPCSHIFHVMKLEQMVRIPPTLIIERWTKSTKKSASYIVDIAPPHMDKHHMEVAKFGSLAAACNNLCLIASKNEHAYTEAVSEIQRLTSKFEQVIAIEEDGILGNVLGCDTGIQVKNPPVISTKGCGKRSKNDVVKIRKCSQCQQTGHNKRNCSIKIMTANDEGGSSISGKSVSSHTYWMPSTPECSSGFASDNLTSSTYPTPSASEAFAGFGSDNYLFGTSSQGCYENCTWWPYSM